MTEEECKSRYFLSCYYLVQPAATAPLCSRLIRSDSGAWWIILQLQGHPSLHPSKCLLSRYLYHFVSLPSCHFHVFRTHSLRPFCFFSQTEFSRLCLLHFRYPTMYMYTHQSFTSQRPLLRRLTAEDKFSPCQAVCCVYAVVLLCFSPRWTRPKPNDTLCF